MQTVKKTACTLNILFHRPQAAFDLTSDPTAVPVKTHTKIITAQILCPWNVPFKVAFVIRAEQKERQRLSSVLWGEPWHQHKYFRDNMLCEGKSKGAGMFPERCWNLLGKWNLKILS